MDACCDYPYLRENHVWVVSTDWMMSCLYSCTCNQTWPHRTLFPDPQAFATGIIWMEFHGIDWVIALESVLVCLLKRNHLVGYNSKFSCRQNWVHHWAVGSGSWRLAWAEFNHGNLWGSGGPSKITCMLKSIQTLNTYSPFTVLKLRHSDLACPA